MNAHDKIRAAMQAIGVVNYDLVWQVSQQGKPHSFRLTRGDVTARGSTVRSVIRAARRAFQR